MKKIITLMIIFQVIIQGNKVFSQPVFVKEDILPRIGDFFAYNNTQEKDTIGKVKGPDVTWIYTCCYPSFNTQYINIKDPADTPYHASFPNSDFCEVSEYEFNVYTLYSYQGESGDVLQEHGAAYEFPTRTNYAFFENYHDLIQFPIHYGDSMRDAYAGMATSSKETFPRHGERNCIVDGYGTLIYSIGDTLRDVLRISCHDYHVDSMLLSYDSSYSSTISWYKAGIRAPLIVFQDAGFWSHLYSELGGSGGGYLLSKYLDPQFILEQLTAVEQPASTTENDFVVYPNPSLNKQITISGKIEIDEIFVLNALGFMIYEEKPYAPTVSLYFDAAGIYFAHLKAGGKDYIKKIIIGN